MPWDLGSQGKYHRVLSVLSAGWLQVIPPFSGTNASPLCYLGTVTQFLVLLEHRWPHHYLFVEYAVSHLGKAPSRTSEEEQRVGSLTGMCQFQNLRGTLEAVRIIIANAYEALTTCHPWSKHIPGSISFNPHHSPLMWILLLSPFGR